ncbi:cell division protein FtsQ/DivIB [Buchnera aphidicola (Neophyllaphis podocarpi)]|uniref:cell division protein FtsQ/DivIB n=1 Tax=Buchnera aphidicola TaxID=9 RepID=UPI0031B8790F
MIIKKKHFFLISILIVLIFFLFKEIYIKVNKNFNYKISEIIILNNNKYINQYETKKTTEKLINYSINIENNLDYIKNKLKNIEWIKDIKIKAINKNLKINLILYEPIAYWNDIYMIDVNAKIFYIPKIYQIKNNLPKIYGLKKKQTEILVIYKKINKILENKKIKIKELYMKKRYSCKLITNSNIIIEIGNKDKIEKLKNLIIIWPMLHKEEIYYKKKIVYIDLRYNYGIAVKYQKN